MPKIAKTSGSGVVPIGPPRKPCRNSPSAAASNGSVPHLRQRPPLAGPGVRRVSRSSAGATTGRSLERCPPRVRDHGDSVDGDGPRDHQDDRDHENGAVNPALTAMAQRASRRRPPPRTDGSDLTSGVGDRTGLAAPNVVPMQPCYATASPDRVTGVLAGRLARAECGSRAHRREDLACSSDVHDRGVPSVGMSPSSEPDHVWINSLQR